MCLLVVLDYNIRQPTTKLGNIVQQQQQRRFGNRVQGYDCQLHTKIQVRKRERTNHVVFLFLSRCLEYLHGPVSNVTEGSFAQKYIRLSKTAATLYRDTS